MTTLNGLNEHPLPPGTQATTAQHTAGAPLPNRGPTTALTANRFSDTGLDARGRQGALTEASNTAFRAPSEQHRTNALVAYSDLDTIQPIANPASAPQSIDLLSDEFQPGITPTRPSGRSDTAMTSHDVSALSEEAQIAEAIRRSLLDASASQAHMVPFQGDDVGPERTLALEGNPSEHGVNDRELAPYAPGARQTFSDDASTLAHANNHNTTGIADSDYSDAPIEVLVARTREVDKTISQNMAELKPKGKVGRWTQQARARVASLATHRQDQEDWQKRAQAFNGRTDACAEDAALTRAFEADSRGLRRQFDDLNRTIASLNEDLHAYKNRVNQKANVHKLARFTTRFESIAAEHKRLETTIQAGTFLDNSPNEDILTDNLQFLDNDPLSQLADAVSELRHLFVQVKALGNKNTYTLSAHHAEDPLTTPVDHTIV